MPKPQPLPDGLLDAVRETPHMTAFLERMGMATTARERRRMRELLKRRGVDTSHWCHSPTHTYPDDAVRASGFDTSHFLGQAHRRGQRSPRRPPAEVLVVLTPGSRRPRPRVLRSAMAVAGVPEVCVLCGCDGSWRGSPLRLEVDHINRDWLDNRLENLRFLCPNCHAQTDTWCRPRGR